MQLREKIKNVEKHFFVLVISHNPGALGGKTLPEVFCCIYLINDSL